MYPVALQQRVNDANVVLEGRIIDQQSFNTANGIHTEHQLKVYKVFKGQSIPAIVSVITIGGTVGNEALEVFPSLKLQKKAVGTFILGNPVETNSQSAVDPSYHFKAIYSGQSYIAYDEVEAYAHGVFERYGTGNILYNAIHAITNTSPQIVENYYLSGQNFIGMSMMMPMVDCLDPNVLSAGTRDTLTIIGSGFGPWDTGWDNGGNCLVEFRDANNGGAGFYPTASTHILSWTPTQIEVLIPTRAGTGDIRVTDMSSVSSTSAMTVDIFNAHLNRNSNTPGPPPHFSHLTNDNGSNGYTFQYSTNTANGGVNFSTHAGAPAAFQRAVNTWNTTTGFNVNVVGTTTVNFDNNDGVNACFFDNAAAPLPMGVLGRNYSQYSYCGNLWELVGLDIEFVRDGTNGVNWNFATATPIPAGTSDFESTALHELGHAQQMGHIIYTGEIMNWSATQGTHSRVPHACHDIEIGQFIAGISTPYVGAGVGSCNSGSYATHPSIATGTTNGAACAGPTYPVTIPVITPPMSTSTCSPNTISLMAAAPAPAGYTFQWFNNGVAIGGATAQSYNAAVAGTYTVELIGACPIPASNGVTITISAMSSSPIVTPDSIVNVCSSGSIVLSSSIAPVGGSYQWYLNGSIIPLATNQTYNAMLSGQYSVEFTGPCPSGLSDTTTVIFSTTPATPVASASGSTSNCTGTPISLSATATPVGYGYQWYFNGTAIAGATMQNYNAMATGNYTVVFTGPCPSVASNAIAVSISNTPTTPVINTANPTSFCAGDSAILNSTVAPTGYSYQWYNAGAIIPGATNQTYTALVSGAYFVALTGPCPPANSNVLNITVSGAASPPTITASGATTFCTGDSVILSSTLAPAGYSYQWYLNGMMIFGSTNQTLAVYAAGNYTVQFTGLCTSAQSAATTTMVVSSLPAPTVTPLSPTTICVASTVTLQSSVAPLGYGYQWYLNGISIPLATMQTYVASTAGAYTVQLVGSCGGGASNAINVVVNAMASAPIISTMGNATICVGDSVLLTSTGAVGGNSYQWYLNGSLIAGANNQTYHASAAGNYSAAFTGVCPTGQSAAFNVSVIAPPTQPSITTQGGSTVICLGTNFILTSSLAPVGSNYQWYFNGMVLINDTLQTLNASAAGNYSVQIMGTCNSTQSAIVTLTASSGPTAPTITALGSTTFCTGGNVVLQSNAPPTGYTYQWYQNGIAIPGATITSYVANFGGNFSVAFVPSAPGNCPSPQSAITTVTVVSAPSAPSLVTSGPSTFCFGTVFTLTGGTAPAGFGYQWQQGGGNLPGANSNTYNPVTNGTYTLVYIDSSIAACNSLASASVTVTIIAAPAIPVLTTPTNIAFCIGDTATLAAAAAPAGFGYLWLSGGIPIIGANSQIFKTQMAGTYTCLYTDSSAAACNSGQSIVTTVTVNPLPTINFAGDTLICQPGTGATLADESTVLTASGALTYEWYNAGGLLLSNMDTVLINQAGFYTVVATDANGCMASRTIPISVIFCAGPNFTSINLNSTLIFHDLDENGIFDPNETVIPNIGVEMINSIETPTLADDTVIATSITDANGHFYFAPIDTSIKEVYFKFAPKLFGWRLTNYQNNSAAPIELYDSDPDDNTGRTGMYALSLGVNSLGVSAGYVTYFTGIDNLNVVVQNIFPNPVKNQLNLEVFSPTSITSFIDVTNIAGKSILRKRAELKSGLNTLTIETNGLAESIYFVGITKEDGPTQYHKFLKLK